MIVAESSDSAASETDALLTRSASCTSSHTSTPPKAADNGIAQKGKHTRWPSWLNIPTFETIHPRFRFIPLVGCLIILTNEAEFFFKQAATMRAVESLYCIEYYNIHDPELAHRLGRNIPERLCKADSIEKLVAQTWAWIMLARMLSAMVSALPLGRLADTWGRRPVLILHKLAVVVSAVWQLCVCEYTIHRSCRRISPQD